jgi:HK97 gp10 family phage protein
MGKACALVEAEAKKKAPKGDGTLRRSITSEVVVNEDTVEGIVFTPLEYAPYVEYGTGIFAEGGGGRQDVPWRYQDDEGNWHTTSGMSPRPYMRPALNENREKIKEILKEGLLSND